LRRQQQHPRTIDDRLAAAEAHLCGMVDAAGLQGAAHIAGAFLFLGGYAADGDRKITRGWLAQMSALPGGFFA